jgi:hypothetical protein
MSFDYFKSKGLNWQPVPPAAQKAFPEIEEIMQRKIIPSPLK